MQGFKPPLMAHGAVVDPCFSGDHMDVLWAPFEFLEGLKWGSTIPIFWKLNPKIEIIFIFNYACSILKFNFNIQNFIWYTVIA